MTKRMEVTYTFVDYIPEDLDEGVIYIALEFGAVIHLCCDGCGERVSTPLHPAQWKLIFDGETVSIQPSVGSSELACNSHYIIERNRVRWCRPLTEWKAAKDRAADVATVDRYFDPKVLPRSGPSAQQPTKRVGLWRRLLGRRF